MKWQTLFQTKKTRSSNENDSDSLGLFKLLESRTFDYLSLFHGKKKEKKVKFAVSSMDWEKRKPVEQPVNEVNTGGNAFPALKRLLSVTPSSPFFSFHSPPCTPTFFVNVRPLAIYLDIITIDETSAIFWSIDVFRWFSAVREPSLALKTWADMGWMIWGMERRRRKAKERGFEIEESRGRRWEWIEGEIKS